MPYAHDVAAAKVYLDLNRNWDLTDDPKNVFPVGRSDQRNETFDRELELTQQDGTKRYQVNIVNVFELTLMVNSGWSGEMELDGRRWQVSLTDDVNGEIDSGDYFVIEPAGGTRFPSEVAEDLDMHPAKQWLLGDTCCQFKFRWVGENIEVAPKLRERPPGLCELQGQHIALLVLNDIAIPMPATTFALPPGAYLLKGVLLKDGDHSAYANLGFPPQLEPMTSVSRSGGQDGFRLNIDPSAPATLAVGAPLRHTADIARSAGLLTLTYQLKGIGGETYEYRPAGTPRPVLPMLKVYQGDRLLFSGPFTYG